MSRIAALPRRNWEDSINYQDIIDLTNLLRTPHGTQTLRKVQAAALYEAAETSGLFAHIRVGGGKTLISALLPVVMGARRPILFVPGSLTEKTRRELQQLRQHWDIPYLRVDSYNKLGLEKYADMLDKFQPDLIILDEAHKTKRVETAACARRLARYFYRHPRCRCAAMSGSFGENVGDYGHILDWCLREGSPAPRTMADIKIWSDCLDPSTVDPLFDHMSEDLGPISSTAQAQIRFRDRLRESEGVIISTDAFEEARLDIRPKYLPPDPRLEPHFQDLRLVYEAPDGWPFAEPMEVWKVAKQMALGFYYLHDPRPPEDWYQARKNYCKYARWQIQNSEVFDTERQVRTALEAGNLRTSIWKEWLSVKDTFVPNTVCEWLSDHALKACHDWGKHRKKAIIWCEHRAFAQKLSEATGWRYFANHGVHAESGDFIELSRDPVIIASVEANCTGRNLQYYRENLITSPPSSADRYEQLLGRTHREGQKSKSVLVEYLVSCYENVASFRAAKDRAKMVEMTTGQVQKILWADVIDPKVKYKGPLWSK